MNARLQRLMAEAQALPPDEQAVLVVSLLDSLGNAVDAAEAWRTEIRHRRLAMESGADSAVDWAQARARLQAL
jgi:putative addiction module component (TIGR02574 family)